MYQSTFLVNRQMITDPTQINKALSRYSSIDGEAFNNFFYRLEWYRIGISIPMLVYSKKMPSFQLVPECQLNHTEELAVLPQDLKEVKFKIFIIPYKQASKNEDLDFDFIQNWFQKKIKTVAEIIEAEFGPNNRIYYKSNSNSQKMNQIQSYSLRGKLKVLDSTKLEEIRQLPLGYYQELGCGLLLLE